MDQKHEYGIRVSVKRVEFYNIDLIDVHDRHVAREMVQEMLDVKSWDDLKIEEDNGWVDIIMLEDIETGEQIVEGEDDEPTYQD
jgi:hypothetical protein